LAHSRHWVNDCPDGQAAFGGFCAGNALFRGIWRIPGIGLMIVLTDKPPSAAFVGVF